MTRQKWYLYIWHDVLEDYTSGMACAVARDLQEALAIFKDKIYTDLPCDADHLDIYDLPPEKAVGHFVYGGS